MVHGVAVIAEAPAGRWVSRHVLARHYGLPEAYLAKHLKALVRAGVLVATPGPTGGFRLARPAAEITVLDIVEAIEGTSPPFVCHEIRQQGAAAAAVPPEGYRRPCAVDSLMQRAHRSWQATLRDVTVDDIVASTPKRARDMIMAGLGDGLSKHRQTPR